MAVIKSFLGVDIEVNQAGQFKAQIRGKGVVSREKLADLEKLISDSQPEGKLELMDIPYLSSSAFQRDLAVTPPKKKVITKVVSRREGRGKYASMVEEFQLDDGSTTHKTAFARWNPEIIAKFESINVRYRAFMAELYGESKAAIESLEALTADEIKALLANGAE